MSGRWIITDPRIVPQNIDDTLTTQQLPLGTVVKARDNTNTTNNQGEGEFIYLKGVAATTAGDVVEYDQLTAATTRWAGTANKGKPLAVAMSANVANQFGWYQIGGAAVINISGAIAANDAAFFNATATLQTAAVAGKQVLNCNALSANGVPAAGKAIYEIDRPFAQGQIT